MRMEDGILCRSFSRILFHLNSLLNIFTLCRFILSSLLFDFNFLFDIFTLCWFVLSSLLLLNLLPTLLYLLALLGLGFLDFSLLDSFLCHSFGVLKLLKPILHQILLEIFGVLQVIIQSHIKFSLILVQFLYCF